MSTTIPQLLLVRYLFQKGQDTLGETGPYSAGLAVSLFQDAIELMARTIVDHVDASVGKNTSFDGLWDAIKTGKKNVGGKELPLKTKALAVNNARIGFKHYGNLPDAAQSARFETDTGVFLELSCKDFFGLEFKDISLVDLIQQKEASNHLRNAIKAVSSEDIEKALMECTFAFHYLGAYLEGLVPKVAANYSRVYSHDSGPSVVKLETSMQSVEHSLSQLRNFTLATALGFSIFEYIHFKTITPSLAVSMTGKYQVQQWAGRKRTIEDAKAALKFATDFGIAVEGALAELTPSDRDMLFGARTLVHPDAATS